MPVPFQRLCAAAALSLAILPGVAQPQAPAAVPAYAQAGTWVLPLSRALPRLVPQDEAPLALEFDAAPGDAVRAPADGEIVFDGQVTVLDEGAHDASLERYAGHGVVLRHAPGLYYLLSSSRAWDESPGRARIGSRVRQGERLGRLSTAGEDRRGMRPNLVLAVFAHDPALDFAASWQQADAAAVRQVMPRFLRGVSLDVGHLVGGAVLRFIPDDDIDSDGLDIRLNGEAVERYRWRERNEFSPVFLGQGPHELVVRHGFFIFKSEYRTLIQVPAGGSVEQSLRMRDDRVVVTGSTRFRSRFDDSVQALRAAEAGGWASTVAASGTGLPPAVAPAVAPPPQAAAVTAAATRAGGEAGARAPEPAPPVWREQMEALERARQELERERRELEQQRLAVLAPPAPPAPALPQRPALRAHALVIGNSAYAGSARLPNPSNDAREIARVLRELGFDVTEGLDADRNAFVRTLSEYARRAAGADVSLFFYAGHGVQVHGVNYIVPVDFDMRDPEQIIYHGISLNAVVEQSLPGRAKLVFLDACRDNPLQVARTRGISRGLAPISVAEGTLIAYATKDGSTAEDGRGRHSPFTAALLEHLRDPDDIAVVLRKVREKVMRATGGRQQPWEYGSLTGGALVLSEVARPR